jgi:hypothetical protein
MMMLDDLLWSGGMTPLEFIREFIGRHNASIEFRFDLIQESLRISNNQAQGALRAGIGAGTIASSENKDFYIIVRCL